MATSNDRAFIDKIIAGNGRIDPEDAPDNPWCVKIVQYRNSWDVTTYGCIFENEDLDRYKETHYVRNPFTLWERKA